MTADDVLLRALGDDAHRLHPELLRQLNEPALHREGRGVFTRAGSRFRWVTALGRPVAGADALVTRFERDVPFVVTTAERRDDEGRIVLDTMREFGFRRGTQRIVDRLTPSVHPGLVRNLLGRSGRIELIEECSVSERGFLRMRTRRVALRLAGRRFALKGVLRLDVLVEDGWDANEERRTIEMRARNPIFGTVLEYRGWYRLVDVDASGDQ